MVCEAKKVQNFNNNKNYWNWNKKNISKLMFNATTKKNEKKKKARLSSIWGVMALCKNIQLQSSLQRHRFGAIKINSIVQTIGAMNYCCNFDIVAVICRSCSFVCWGRVEGYFGEEKKKSKIIDCWWFSLYVGLVFILRTSKFLC